MDITNVFGANMTLVQQTLAQLTDNINNTRRVVATQQEDIDNLSRRIEFLETASTLQKPGIDELQMCRAELARLQKVNAQQQQTIETYSTKAGNMRDTINELNDNLKRTIKQMESDILAPLRQKQKKG